MMDYADDVNIMGEVVHSIQKITEGLLVASKEIVLEVNIDKTKYISNSDTGRN
jgi:hypothetical protein